MQVIHLKEKKERENSLIKVLDHHWIQTPLCQCQICKMVGWYQILAHTSEPQLVSSEGVKINTSVRGTSAVAEKLTVTRSEWEIMTKKQHFTLTFPSTHGILQQESNKYSWNVVNSAQAIHFCQAQWIIYCRGPVGVGQVLKGSADNQR